MCHTVLTINIFHALPFTLYFTTRDAAKLVNWSWCTAYLSAYTSQVNCEIPESPLSLRDSVRYEVRVAAIIEYGK